MFHTSIIEVSADVLCLHMEAFSKSQEEVIMAIRKRNNKEQQILVEIYESSLSISMTALIVIAGLEIIMLVYSFINTSLYQGSQGRYRLFYIALLSVAVVYMALNQYARKDIQNRYRLLDKANPLCAIIFFIWSLGITYSDMQIHHAIDPSVFMTFSMTVPLSFYLRPPVYAAIALAADSGILYITALASGLGPVFINLALFIVFQFVLGISFMKIKSALAKSVLEEKEIAFTDAMTGFFNRRAYMDDLKNLSEDPDKNELVYIAIDVNGLKEVNDIQGHEAGDKLLEGAATCMENTFGDKGALYRIGGDEFVVLANIKHNEINQLFADYDKKQKEWSHLNHLTLASAYGYAFFDEIPAMDPEEIATKADQRMYEAKATYYQQNGKKRRKQWNKTRIDIRRD